jgi:hypothetical protein
MDSVQERSLHRDKLRNFEGNMLKRIFEPKEEEVTRDGEKYRNEELHNLYSSFNIGRVIKSRRRNVRDM